MKTKKRNDELISRAYDLLTGGKSDYAKNLFEPGKNFIKKSFASQVAAFSVSVAMIGLKPTLAMYYKQGGAAVDTHNIIGIIAEMLVLDGYTFQDQSSSPAKNLFEYAMNKDKQVNEDKKLLRDVIDNAIALKVVVRTFLNDEE